MFLSLIIEILLLPELAKVVSFLNIKEIQINKKCILFHLPDILQYVLYHIENIFSRQ